MIRLAFLAVGLSLTANTLRGASPDPKALIVPPEQVARAQLLVRQLGSDAFLDRDQATRELRRMGRLALPALTDAVTNGSDDPEIRFRCELLLPRAEHDDVAARISTFLADADGKYTHELPGWDAFRGVIGNDRTSRELFAEIVKDRSQHDLLLATTKNRRELALAVSAYRQQLQMRMNPRVSAPGVAMRPVQPTLADVALLLLAESLVSEKDAPFVGAQYHVSNFFYQPQGRTAIAGNGKFGPAFRQLTLNWLETRDGPHGITTAMTLAQNLNLGGKTVAKFAARLLDSADTQPWNRANAACLIARNGGNDHLPSILKLLSDETVLIRGNNRQPDIQLRDVGLAMALVMTGQEPSAYGFEVANSNPQLRYNYTTFRFRDEEKKSAEDKRKAAIAKWKRWEAEQKSQK